MNFRKLFLVTVASVGIAGLVGGNAGCGCMHQGGNGILSGLQDTNFTGHSSSTQGNVSLLVNGVWNSGVGISRIKSCVKDIHGLVIRGATTDASWPSLLKAGNGVALGQLTRLEDALSISWCHDDSGDGFVSCFPPPGFALGIGFICGQACEANFFADTITMHNTPPGGNGTWAFMTDCVPNTAAASNRQNPGPASMLDLIPLSKLAQLVDSATPVNVDSIGASTDLEIEAQVRRDLPLSAYPLKMDVTEVTVGDLTLEPTNVSFVIQFAENHKPMMAWDPSQPEVKAILAQVAPYVEDAVLKNEVLDFSVTLNDSVTFTTNDLFEMAANNGGVEYEFGRDSVRALYERAGIY
jgi:hypothetical protein